MLSVRIPTTADDDGATLAAALREIADRIERSVNIAPHDGPHGQMTCADEWRTERYDTSRAYVRLFYSTGRR